MRGGGFVHIALEVGILYNFAQLIRQSNTIYFLAYKLFLILYLGCWLIYFDLDIYALFLWMVYGSFIAIVFVFLLMWTDVTREGEDLGVYRVFLWGGCAFIAVLSFLLINIGNWGEWVDFPLIFRRRLNFYEMLVMSGEGELEVLGWGFGFENIAGTLCGAIVLTLACFVVVVIILNARRLRAITLDNSTLAGYLDERYFKYLTLKFQSTWVQEEGAVGTPRRVFKVLHNRRA